jgi:DNA polymerase III alpha subunit
MLFLTLADESGLAECVLFPDAYRALARAVHGEIVRVEGRVDEALGASTVAVSGAVTLSPAAAGAGGARSRNDESPRGPSRAAQPLLGPVNPAAREFR